MFTDKLMCSVARALYMAVVNTGDRVYIDLLCQSRSHGTTEDRRGLDTRAETAPRPPGCIPRMVPERCLGGGFRSADKCGTGQLVGVGEERSPRCALFGGRSRTGQIRHLCERSRLRRRRRPVSGLSELRRLGCRPVGGRASQGRLHLRGSGARLPVPQGGKYRSLPVLHPLLSGGRAWCEPARSRPRCEVALGRGPRAVGQGSLRPSLGYGLRETNQASHRRGIRSDAPGDGRAHLLNELSQRFPPGRVVPVPADGLGEPFTKADARTVAEFTQTVVVERVSQVVTFAVLDPVDAVPVG